MLSSLRLSVAKSKISLGKYHVAFEKMWVTFKHFLIFENDSEKGNRLRRIAIPSNHGIFAPSYMSLDMLKCLLVYRNLNRICILLLCENSINLNHVELVHSVFQVYYIILLLCIFILLIFENLILKLQLKILIYLLKNNCNI